MCTTAKEKDNSCLINYPTQPILWTRVHSTAESISENSCPNE